MASSVVIKFAVFTCLKRSTFTATLQTSKSACTGPLTSLQTDLLNQLLWAGLELVR